MQAEHVRLARAKGLPAGRYVLRHHVLRNAWIPIVTVTGLQLGTLLGGIVVVEVVFSWPGIGRLALDAVERRDYPVLQGAVLLDRLLFLLINLIVDLLYAQARPEDLGADERPLAATGRPRRRRSRWRETLAVLVQNRLAAFGLVVLVLLVLVAVFGDVLARYGINEQSIANRFAPPSPEHWFGTDEFGRDIYSRVVIGARVSLQRRSHRGRHLAGRRHGARPARPGTAAAGSTSW